MNLPFNKNTSFLDVIQITNKEARRSDDLTPTIEHNLAAFISARASAARLEPSHGHQPAAGVIVLWIQHSHHRVVTARRIRGRGKR